MRGSILATVILALAVLFTTKAHAQNSRIAVPNIQMPVLEGSEWSLVDHKGKVVVLNFWATWCEPCRTEVPYLVELGKELGPRGLIMAGVTLDENVDVVKKFVAENKVDYPVLLPPAGSPWTRLENTPTTLLIDREGRLAHKYTGAVPEHVLRSDAEKLLSETPR